MGVVTLKDALRPKETGEMVVQHVLPAVKEPAPNFRAMKRFIVVDEVSDVPSSVWLDNQWQR